MPISDNIRHYVCDRDSSHSAYTQTSDPENSNWHEIERITVDGNRITRWLCRDCYEQYKSLTQKQDSEFNSFMLGSDK